MAKGSPWNLYSYKDSSIAWSKVILGTHNKVVKAILQQCVKGVIIGARGARWQGHIQGMNSRISNLVRHVANLTSDEWNQPCSLSHILNVKD